jgi:hypothetical protein
MAVEIDQAVPLPDAADQASVWSAKVRRARQASRYARDELRAGGATRWHGRSGTRSCGRGAGLLPAYHGVTSGPSADW